MVCTRNAGRSVRIRSTFPRNCFRLPPDISDLTLPEALDALPEIVVQAGDYRLVGSSIRVDGYQPDYRPPPALGQNDAETYERARKYE